MHQQHSSLLLQDPTSVALPHNLMDLEYLNEPSLLQALHSLWDSDKSEVRCCPHSISCCVPAGWMMDS